MIWSLIDNVMLEGRRTGTYSFMCSQKQNSCFGKWSQLFFLNRREAITMELGIEIVNKALKVRAFDLMDILLRGLFTEK